LDRSAGLLRSKRAVKLLVTIPVIFIISYEIILGMVALCTLCTDIIIPIFYCHEALGAAKRSGDIRDWDEPPWDVGRRRSRRGRRSKDRVRGVQDVRRWDKVPLEGMLDTILTLQDLTFLGWGNGLENGATLSWGCGSVRNGRWLRRRVGRWLRVERRQREVLRWWRERFGRNEFGTRCGGARLLW
jgi:hypothetical protein